MKIFTSLQLRRISLIATTTLILSLLTVFANAQADKYWSGNGPNDDFSQGGNWYNGNPSSGDNLYFNNTLVRHFAYSNYGAGSYFNFFITYNGAGGIKLYGDNTYAKKFENNSDGSLLELSPSSAAAGNREIGNRINEDLEINPVGNGGILVSCDRISMDNLNGSRSLKVYGSKTLTINGYIYEKNGTGATLQLMTGATVELKGNSTFTGLTTVNSGLLKLNAVGGALLSGNAVTLGSGGTLQVMQDQTLGNLAVPTGATLVVDANKTLTITGSFTGGGTIVNNGTIILASGSPQSFPGNGSITAMNNLTINNNSITGVTLDRSALSVTGTLAFLARSGGKALFTTGSNVLTANTITGAGTTNGWVNGNLKKNFSAAGTKLFEVGDAGNYTPASLNVTLTSFVAGELQVAARSGNATSVGNPTLSLNTAIGINRLWSVTKPAGSTFGGSYTGTFTYVPGDLVGSPVISNLVIGIYNGTMWYYRTPVTPGSLQVTTTSGTIPMPTNDIIFASSRPVTIGNVSVTTKVYNASPAANLNTATATVTGRLNGDDVTVNASLATGAYDDKHVGSGKPVTTSGFALGGSQAAAYTLAAQPTLSGNITALPLIISAATNTKPYDGNTSAAAIPVISTGAVQGSDMANFIETYDNKNAGSGKILTASGIVNDGNSGNNYTYSFNTNNTGVITNIPISNLAATPGKITCAGGTTTLTVSASGGDGALQYSLSGSATFAYQSSTVFSGVAAGTYTLTVKDEDDFTEQLTGIVVSEPATFAATFTKTNKSACNIANDGTITVTPVGGTAPYNYVWTGALTGGGTYTGPNSGSITGLAYGFYNVSVTDAGGCGVVTLNNIHIENAYTVYVTNNGSISATCANTGSILLYGNAGIQPYTYSLDGNTYQGSNTFTDLAPGDYTAYVKDAGGCVSTKAVSVGVAAPLVVTSYARGSSFCVADGSIELYRTGGIGPYTYSLDNATYQNSNKFTGLAAGTYTGYVKDAKGCVGSVGDIVVIQGAALAVTAGKSNTSTCVTDGSFQLRVTGGVAPYTYSMDNISYQAGSSFTGLGAGTYTGYVKDSKGCTGSVNITINQNPIVVVAQVVNAGSCAANNGKITLYRGSGGVGPYTYSLDGDTYQSSNVFPDVAAGTYDGYVKDSKTCVGVQNNITVGPANCSVPPVAAWNSKIAGKTGAPAETTLELSAYPNPAVSAFTLVLTGYNNLDKVIITVTDVLGSVVFKTEGRGSRQYRFGEAFKAGVYQVQAMQAGKKQTIKLIKE